MGGSLREYLLENRNASLISNGSGRLRLRRGYDKKPVDFHDHAIYVESSVARALLILDRRGVSYEDINGIANNGNGLKNLDEIGGRFVYRDRKGVLQRTNKVIEIINLSGSDDDFENGVLIE